MKPAPKPSNLENHPSKSAPFSKKPVFPPPNQMFILLIQFQLLLSPFAISGHANQAQNLQSMNMDPLEKETLFQIMDTMSSDRQWRISNPNPCKPGSSWPGIECKPGKDNRFHVSRLDFGTYPNPFCKITAIFPSAIFNLPYLQSVFFFNCFTHTKTSFVIPTTPPKTTSSLQQLSLRSNQGLTGPIPTQISLLKSLQILTLSQNRFSGHIPAEISSLTSLLHLDLSYNSLTGKIPNQIGNLRNLVGLDLSYNSLSGPVPATIGNMGGLQKLDLSSNSLTGLIPETFGNLALLVFMALSNNKLKGGLPQKLDKLQNIQYFIMDDNPMFMPLPAELGRLVKLQELRLANSGYTGTIPETFTQLLNLSSLSLQNNRLTGNIPAGLANLSHIYHLNLSKNMLVGVVPFSSGFLQRLGRNLDVSGNTGLCVDGSETVEGMRIGVGVCGKNRNGPVWNNGSVVLPLKRSEAPPGLCNLCNSLCLLGVWLLYQSLF